MATAVLGEDVACPLRGDSAICSGPPPGYPAEELPAVKRLEGSTEADVGVIISVVRIHGTVMHWLGEFDEEYQSIG